MRILKWTLLFLFFLANYAFSQQHDILSADKKDAEININQCVDAAPGLMMLVTPIDDPDNRRFRIKQLLGQQEYFFMSIKDQISQRKILGKSLCNGVVTYSDMNLPFAKMDTERLTDANDGLVLIEMANKRISEIKNLIKDMIKVADQAIFCSDSQRDNLKTAFNAYRNEIERIVFNTRFGYEHPLAYTQTISVPVNKMRNAVSISFLSLDTGENGLNIETLELTNEDTIRFTKEALLNALLVVDKATRNLEAARFKLKEAAEQDEIITSVDLRDNEFMVRKEGSTYGLAHKVSRSKMLN